MSARQSMSNGQKVAAWRNSGGQLHNGKPIGKTKCPWKKCRYGFMRAINRGNKNPDDWVVDHKKPLASGGTNNQLNLQAMHNACNNEKGDSY